MLLGIYLAIKINALKTPQQEAVPRPKLLVLSTALGIVFRVLIMAILAYVSVSISNNRF